jgi:ectoine hydroxylase-related dioxygenase (phytanoyl-CoA dioxygenase family)
VKIRDQLQNDRKEALKSSSKSSSRRSSRERRRSGRSTSPKRYINKRYLISFKNIDCSAIEAEAINEEVLAAVAGQLV